ncbi:MAG: ATP-binding protein [Saprospiraceae bacterium]|nr:ATP-binding protein [Saprospiraceae bacterium]
MKSEEEVILKAKELIEASKAGFEKESPKIDFKYKWYNLISKYGKNELAKDMSSIANTVGLDGYIIIGFNEKNKLSQNAPFEDSGLNDTADVTNLLLGKVSNLFQFQIIGFEHKGYEYHVIHIPPKQLNKPIIITEGGEGERPGKKRAIQNTVQRMQKLVIISNKFFSETILQQLLLQNMISTSCIMIIKTLYQTMILKWTQ